MNKLTTEQRDYLIEKFKCMLVLHNNEKTSPFYIIHPDDFFNVINLFTEDTHE